MTARAQDRRPPFLHRATRGAAAALMLGLVLGAPVSAGPIAVIESGAGAALPETHAVLDIRSEDRCLESGPPDARCLPAAQLLYGQGGEPLGFHALRWALGTLGLSGDETLVIYPGEEVSRDDALAAAALLYLNGQAEVLVHEGAALETDHGGQFRAMWREVIYTAPIRTGAMRPASAPGGALRDRLRDFAANGGVVAFGSGN